jgi:hypothetical protein
MTIVVERPDSQRLVARLREGDVETEVTGWQPDQAAARLIAALDAAATDGYGECFWLEPTGHYWWMFKVEDRSVEVVVLWSRSSAVGWQHVFRASDEIGYVRDMINHELLKA